MAKFPTYEEMAKNVAEKALDNFEYQGKTIREWMKIITEQEPCEDAVSRKAVKELLDEYYAELTLDEKALESNATAIKVTRNIINDIESLPHVTPKSETVTEFADRCRECGASLGKIRAEIEKKYPSCQCTGELTGYAEAVEDFLQILDKHKESEHKRTIDADELLKRIAEKCKIPSLSEDTINWLCAATAIVYDMLNESEQEQLRSRFRESEQECD